MEPTVIAGDSLVADMHYYHHRDPSREDIVILHSPDEPQVILLKRVVAIAGDTIWGVRGQVYLNGKPLSEPYVQHIGNAPYGLMNFGPITIPAHKVFVMGDNRDISLDSRMPEFGLINDSAIMGKALYVIATSRDRVGRSLH